MLRRAAQDDRVEPPKMREIEILGLELAPANPREAQQLDERHKMGVTWREANPRKRSVIAAPVAVVFRQKKRMMDAVTSPERDAVLVVLDYSGEGRRTLEIVS